MLGKAGALLLGARWKDEGEGGRHDEGKEDEEEQPAGCKGGPHARNATPSKLRRAAVVDG